jgi:hypothetical protein
LTYPGHIHSTHQPMAAVSGMHTDESDEEKSAIQSFKCDLVENDGHQAPTDFELSTLTRVADEIP